MQRFLYLVLAAAAWLTFAAHAAEETPTERYDVFPAGNVTYSNVLIMNKTRTDVFIRHPGGLVSVKVKDLDKTTQLQLGYHLVLGTDTNSTARANSPMSMREMDIDPRFEEIMEQIVWESQELWARTDRNVIYGVAGGLGVLYLFFCFCCHLVCRKAGLPTSLLVWLPWLKLLPLLRAAGMRPWWLVTTLLPGINVITYIVWSFKIAKARGKGAGVSVMLLLPLFNVLAFLYLAFADRLGGEQPANSRNVIRLNQGRRHAA